MARAALLRNYGEKLHIEDVEIDDLEVGEVLVRLSASGLCHSDLAFLHGTSPVQLPLPALGGHEGSGVVEAVGEGVTRVRPGDAVIMSGIPQCGRCFWC